MPLKNHWQHSRPFCFSTGASNRKANVLSNTAVTKRSSNRTTSLTQTIEDQTTKPSEKPTDSERLNATPAGKPPVVRRGQRTPFRKATNIEVEERTEWLALKLAIQPELKDGEICKLMAERYNIRYRQCTSRSRRIRAPCDLGGNTGLFRL